MLLSPNLPLIGANLQIRKLKKSDLEFLYALDTDVEVKKFVGGPVQTRREEWIRGMSESVERGDSTLAIATQETNNFVGRASIDIWKSEVDERELQILLAREFWGKGYGREVCALLVDAAFNQLSASAVFATTDPKNRASQNLLEAFGFHRIGTKQTLGWQFGHPIFKLTNPIWQK